MSQAQRQALWDAAGHAGIAPVGYGGESGGGGGGGGGGGLGLNIPAFNFDYGQAEAEARAKLEPYYAQKLADAKGDVERAKRLIEEDYARGIRYSEEDKATQLAANEPLAKQETGNLIDTLNKRGVLFSSNQRGDMASRMPYSGLAGQEMGQLDTKQAQRKQAIERAIARQEEIAGVTRTRGIEAQNIQYPRTEQGILEEKENRVQTEFVPRAHERALERYNQTYQQAMNSAINGQVNTNPYLQALGYG